MRTRLFLRSRSRMESLLDKDMIKYRFYENEEEEKQNLGGFYLFYIFFFLSKHDS